MNNETVVVPVSRLYERAVAMTKRSSVLDAGNRGIFQRLRQELRNGARWPYGEFGLGTEIPDQWMDIQTGKVYDMPWVIVDYRMVWRDGGERAGVVLLRKHATPMVMPFNKIPNGLYPGSDVDRWLNGEYMAGCSDALREVVIPAYVSIYDSLFKEDCMYQYVGRFFLPSCEELGLDINNKNIDMEKAGWGYFTCKTIISEEKLRRRRVFVNPQGEAQVCHLRSNWIASRRDHWTLQPDGSKAVFGSEVECAVVPACIIA